MDKSHYQESINEALVLIKTNYSRLNKKDVVQVINERIFLNEFNREQNTWTKKASSMQELQCVDCIMKFFESESNFQVRDFMFDLLFSDIYQVKSVLTVLMSFAISLEAQNTLDCISKWIIANIGNELVQTMINQIIKDHFVLTVNKADQQTEADTFINPSLVALVNRSPLFASLFMTITLDMLPNELLLHPDKCLPKMLKLFEVWIEKNDMLPVIAYKSNMLHASAYMLNPLPGLIYITVIHPLKNYTDQVTTTPDLHSNLLDKLAKSNEFADKVHYITLKILRDLSNTLESTKVKQLDQFKLLTINHLEFVCKQIGEAEQKLKDHIERQGLQEISDKLTSGFRQLFNDSLDKLAQVLELSSQYGFIVNAKAEIRNVFSSFIRNQPQEMTSLDPNCLLEIILCS